MDRQLLSVLAAMAAGVQAVASTGNAAVSENRVANPADTMKVQTLGNVEVVATRASSTTPVAFSNVTASQIAKANTGVDLPYLLQATPSVVTTSDAGAGVGYTSIRVRGTDGSRINVTANGIPINEAESHNVYWVNMPDLSSTLKDVQIQRGAGTSTNGAGAFGASINMQTSTPAYEQYAQADATYGSYNTNKQTLRVGSGMLGDHYTVDARISHIGSDGYIERATSQLWSYFTQAAYYNDATSLKLVMFGGKERTYHAWDYATRDQIEQYGRRYNPCGEYIDTDGNVAYYPDQYDNYIQYHNQLILNHSAGKHWHVNAALHYSRGDGYYEQYKTGQKFYKYGLAPYLLPDGTVVNRSDLVRLKKMKNDFYGGIFSVKYTDGPLQAIIGGGANNYIGHHNGEISWLRNYVGPLDPLQRYYDNDANKTDLNIYARAHYALAKGMSVYADLQYRHIDYDITGTGDTYDDAIETMQRLDIHRIFNFFNPKAGIDWQTDNGHRVYASMSVAHREPTRDNFIDRVGDRWPLAERLYDYEAGYSYAGRRFSAGVNLYYMDYKNQLVPTGRISDTGNTVSENVPHSYRAGVELTWAYRPVEAFTWNLTATLSRNRIKDYVEYIYGDGDPMTVLHHDTPISFSPDLTLHNSLDFSHGGFTASLQSQYVSRQYLDNSGQRSVSLDPYFYSDLHLGYDFGRIAGLEDLSLGVVVYNIFNEKYENNGWAYSYYYTDGGERIVGREAGYAVQAPIHMMGTLSIKF